MRLIDADSLLVNMDKGIQGTARGVSEILPDVSK